MFCSNCGSQIPDESRFCHACGSPVTETRAPRPEEAAPARRGIWRLQLFAGLGATVAGAVAVAVLVIILADPFGGESEGGRAGSPSPELSVQDFAPEYVRHAIDGDEEWLQGHTMPGYYDFSLPWLERLQGCNRQAAMGGPARSAGDSNGWVAAVTFDPPCEPRPAEEGGITLTLVFEQDVAKADLLAAIEDLGHPETEVQETTDGYFIVDMGALRGASEAPTVGPTLPSERDSIEDALQDRFGALTVRNFNSFTIVQPAIAYSCVVLRVEGKDDMQAGITRWPASEEECSQDSYWFGNDLGEPSGGVSYLLVEAVTSALPPGADVDDALREVAEVLLRRADAYGAPTALRREGSNRVSAALLGIGPEEARHLMVATALLEFREPERDENNNIVCQDSAGQSFTIPSDTVPDPEGVPRAAYIVMDASGDLTECQGPNDAAPRGSVVWKPATAVDDDKVEEGLTGRFLRSNSRVMFDALGRPLVQLKFNSAGSRLFDQITSRLVGFPIAIVLDDQIVSAPTIRARISDGSAVIEGLTADEGRVLAVQINSGVMPLPLRLIQEFELVQTGGQ